MYYKIIKQRNGFENVIDKQTEMPKKRDEKYLPLYEQINVAKAMAEEKEKNRKKASLSSESDYHTRGEIEGKPFGSIKIFKFEMEP